MLTSQWQHSSAFGTCSPEVRTEPAIYLGHLIRILHISSATSGKGVPLNFVGVSSISRRCLRKLLCSSPERDQVTSIHPFHKLFPCEIEGPHRFSTRQSTKEGKEMLKGQNHSDQFQHTTPFTSLGPVRHSSCVFNLSSTSTRLLQ